MTPVDLNQIPVPSDGTDVERQVDHSTRTRIVDVHFKSIEKALIDEIDRADGVFGCVAWLTNSRILAALARRRSVGIIVQKEDFLRPDSESGPDWRAQLRRQYDAIPGFHRQVFAHGLMSQLSCCGDPASPAVRCAGMIGDRNLSARCHHKFVVFCHLTREDGSYPAGDDEVAEWEPYAVWTGSFNFTANASRSLENAVVIREPAIVLAYFNEFQQVAALSEPLDWMSQYVDPEWRIGT